MSTHCTDAELATLLADCEPAVLVTDERHLPQVERVAAGLGRPGEARTASLHRYAAHVADWRPGDPTWRGDRGKGLIGALNYLAAEGLNAFSFLTMNVDGDGRNVWPWTAPDVRDRFDVSKLAQWEVVFTHADSLGVQSVVVYDVGWPGRGGGVP